MLNNNEWITVQQASVISNITEGYIRRMLICDGFNDLQRGVDYTKFGKVWIIKKSSWESHILKYPKRERNYKEEAIN